MVEVGVVSNRELALAHVMQRMIDAWGKNDDYEATMMERLLSIIENMEDNEFDD